MPGQVLHGPLRSLLPDCRQGVFQCCCAQVSRNCQIESVPRQTEVCAPQLPAEDRPCRLQRYFDTFHASELWLPRNRGVELDQVQLPTRSFRKYPGLRPCPCVLQRVQVGGSCRPCVFQVQHRSFDSIFPLSLGRRSLCRGSDLQVQIFTSPWRPGVPPSCCQERSPSKHCVLVLLEGRQDVVQPRDHFPELPCGFRECLDSLHSVTLPTAR